LRARDQRAIPLDEFFSGIAGGLSRSRRATSPFSEWARGRLVDGASDRWDFIAAFHRRKTALFPTADGIGRGGGGG